MEFKILSHPVPPSNPENYKLASDGSHPRKEHVRNTDLGLSTYIIINVPQVISQL